MREILEIDGMSYHKFLLVTWLSVGDSIGRNEKPVHISADCFFVRLISNSFKSFLCITLLWAASRLSRDQISSSPPAPNP